MSKDVFSGLAYNSKVGPQICIGTGLAPGHCGSAFGLGLTPHLHRDWGSPLPHLHRDWGSPLPHPHRDWAHAYHICSGTGLTPATSSSGLGSPRADRTPAGCAQEPPYQCTLAKPAEEQNCDTAIPCLVCVDLDGRPTRPCTHARTHTHTHTFTHQRSYADRHALLRAHTDMADCMLQLRHPARLCAVALGAALVCRAVSP